MSTAPDIVTGDNVALAVTLKRDGAVFAIDALDTVQAALVSTDHKTAYTAEPISQSDAAPGADWDESLVIVEIPGTATEAITYQGLALLEIQITAGGVNTTFFVPVKIIKGLIP
jgi:hypothetical protein